MSDALNLNLIPRARPIPVNNNPRIPYEPFWEERGVPMASVNSLWHNRDRRERSANLDYKLSDPEMQEGAMIKNFAADVDRGNDRVLSIVLDDEMRDEKDKYYNKHTARYLKDRTAYKEAYKSGAKLAEVNQRLNDEGRARPPKFFQKIQKKGANKFNAFQNFKPTEYRFLRGDYFDVAGPRPTPMAQFMGPSESTIASRLDRRTQGKRYVDSETALRRENKALRKKAASQGILKSVLDGTSQLGTKAYINLLKSFNNK